MIVTLQIGEPSTLRKTYKQPHQIDRGFITPGCFLTAWNGLYHKLNQHNFCFVRDAICYQDTLLASHAHETENEGVDIQDDVDNSCNVIGIGEDSHHNTT